MRSKLFDSVLVELGPQAVDAGATIQDVMERTENVCATHGWDIHLVEKRLFGLEDFAIPCVEEARAVLDIWLGRGDANQEETSASQDDHRDVTNADSVSESETDDDSYAVDHLEKDSHEVSVHSEAGEEQRIDRFAFQVDSSTNAKEGRDKEDGSLCSSEEEVSSATEDGSSIHEYSEVTTTESSEVTDDTEHNERTLP